MVLLRLNCLQNESIELSDDAPLVKVSALLQRAAAEAAPGVAVISVDVPYTRAFLEEELMPFATIVYEEQRPGKILRSYKLTIRMRSLRRVVPAAMYFEFPEGADAMQWSEKVVVVSLARERLVQQGIEITDPAILSYPLETHVIEDPGILEALDTVAYVRQNEFLGKIYDEVIFLGLDSRS